MRNIRYIIIFAFALVSCDRLSYPSRSKPAGMVNQFGVSSSPDSTMRVEVTRREKSLVDFRIIESSSGKILAEDHLGSDFSRWFLYWETPTKLWGWGSDFGYFKVFDFSSKQPVIGRKVTKDMLIPADVWNNMPSIRKEYKKAEQDVACS